LFLATHFLLPGNVRLHIDFGNDFWQKTNFGLLQNWRGLSEKGTRNCAKILRKPKHVKVIFRVFLPCLKSNWNSRQRMQNIFTNYYKNERKISYLFSKWKKVHLDPSRAFTRQTRKKRILCYECSTALWFIVIAGSLFETFSYLVSFAIKVITRVSFSFLTREIEISRATNGIKTLTDGKTKADDDDEKRGVKMGYFYNGPQKTLQQYFCELQMSFAWFVRYFCNFRDLAGCLTSALIMGYFLRFLFPSCSCL